MSITSAIDWKCLCSMQESASRSLSRITRWRISDISHSELHRTDKWREQTIDVVRSTFAVLLECVLRSTAEFNLL
jgi:hypothetical protein